MKEPFLETVNHLEHVVYTEHIDYRTVGQHQGKGTNREC